MTTSTKNEIDYQNLFQSLAAAYIIFDVDDPNFTILEENEAHAKVAMKARKDVIGKPLMVAFPDTSEKYIHTGVSDLLESIRTVISTGKPDVMKNLNYDLKNEEGAYITKYWSVTHYPIFDATHTIVAVYQATLDITDEIVTEQKLVHTQEQLDQALSSGMIGTWSWDIQKNKVYADANLSSMFDLSEREAKEGLPIKKFIDSIHPLDKKRVESEIEYAISHQTKFESEYRTVTSKVGVRWVIVRGQIQYDREGKPEKFPGVIVDVTDRKSAENNLQFLAKASMQLSASLDYKETLNTIASIAVPDIADWCTIALVDTNGVLQQVAVAHKDPKMVSWALELNAVQGPPDMNQPTGAPKVIRTGEPEFYPEITDAMLEQAIKNKERLKLMKKLGFSSVIMVPLVINEKTIGVLTLIAAESRMHYKSADLEMAQGLANRAAMAVDNANLYQSAQRELKERKRLQDQLEVVNSVLESRVLERTKQLVQTNEGLQKEIRQRKEVERELQEYGQNLARSNQELQDFAYVASHDLQEPLRKIQAFGDILESEYSETLGEGLEYLKRMRSAASRMTTLIQDLLAFSRVSTKPQSIAQVNLNVIVSEVIGDLETSIEERNGKITVEKLPIVSADATHMRQLFQNLIGNALKFHRDTVDPIVKISVLPFKKGDTMYTIHVSDNGIGFDEKYLDRIFSVFQRLNNRENYEGTGIGLAVCRKIVERYNGKIDAKSKIGEGSTFIIELPVRSKE